VKTCYFCGTELDIRGFFGRDALCPHCHRDLKCCLNCALYDVVSDYCREPLSEGIDDRERGNFCDFFIFSEKVAPQRTDDRVKKAREEWERLFKK